MKKYIEISKEKVLKLNVGDELYFKTNATDRYHFGVVQYSNLFKETIIVDDLLMISFKHLLEEGIFYTLYTFYLEIEVYSGSEILQQIEEGKLIEDDILIDKNGEENSVYNILETDAMALKDYAPYSVKKREIPLSFSEILDEKYDHDFFKCVNKIKYFDFDSTDKYHSVYWFLKELNRLYTDLDTRKILREAKFYIQ